LCDWAAACFIVLIDLHNKGIIMGFSGAEAFRGTSAPSLKTEVSGEGGKSFLQYIFVMYVVDDVLYDLFT